MATGLPFTTTTLLAAAADILEGSGYRPVPRDRIGSWPGPGARVYEDPYSVAALVAYDTWGDLAVGWLDAQAALVELISSYFARGEAKTWEGYLVLLTPSVLPRAAQLQAADIRTNTRHVRKLVATGDDVRSVGDVSRTLLPLLPLEPEAGAAPEASALDLLPDLLGAKGIDRAAVQVAIDAFRSQESLVERLHEFLSKTVGE
jgi:hypothetical protein